MVSENIISIVLYQAWGASQRRVLLSQQLLAAIEHVADDIISLLDRNIAIAIEAAHGHRSSIVVCLCVCLLVTFVNLQKRLNRSRRHLVG